MAVLISVLVFVVACAGTPMSLDEHASCDFDLSLISHLGSKGRVQDGASGHTAQLVESITAEGPRSIPCLIDLLSSNVRYQERVIPLWPEVFEGDVALIFLDNLFRDPSGRLSSFPDLCWDTLLERGDDESAAGWELLHRFRETHGWEAIRSRWREAWARDQDRVEWDTERRFFRVQGRPLEACR